MKWECLLQTRLQSAGFKNKAHFDAERRLKGNRKLKPGTNAWPSRLRWSVSLLIIVGPNRGTGHALHSAQQGAGAPEGDPISRTHRHHRTSEPKFSILHSGWRTAALTHTRWNGKACACVRACLCAIMRVDSEVMDVAALQAPSYQASVFSLGTICGWSGHKRDLRIVGRRREPTAFLLLRSKDNKDPNMILSPVCEPELSSVFKNWVLNPRSHYKRHIYDFDLSLN